MIQTLMGVGAKQVVEVCARVKEGESVCIITEPKTLSIAEAISIAVSNKGSEPVISLIKPRIADSTEPPKSVAEAMKHSDVFISAVHTSITHTQAVVDATKNGSRGIMLTQFDENMLIDSGVLADFPAAAPTCEKVGSILENAKEIHLTTSYGTDLKMSAVGRKSNSMTGMVEPGEFAPVPTIEANVSPLEGSASGVIVANASIPYLGIGVLENNVVCTVENGNITNIEGGKEAEILREDLEEKDDPYVYNIAEIGVGLNPRCKFNGLMLEDEGVFGSVHIGIGSSITLGGTVKASCHYDLIMTGVTLVVDGQEVIKDGEVLV